MKNATETVITTRVSDNGDHMNQRSMDAQTVNQSSEETCEVQRSRPHPSDSFIGGLDILTVHQVIEEKNMLKVAQKSSAAN